MESNNYVYVIIRENEKMFKVGSSMSFLSRFRTLMNHWGEFMGSEEGSFLIKCDEDFFRQLENMIHKILDNYWIHDLEKKDGSCEFFDIKALPVLNQFLEDLTEYQDRFEICNLEEEIDYLLSEEALIKENRGGKSAKGRPAKGKKKNCKVATYLSEDEFNDLSIRAEVHLGGTISSYLRQLIKKHLKELDSQEVS